MLQSMLQSRHVSTQCHDTVTCFCLVHLALHSQSHTNEQSHHILTSPTQRVTHHHKSCFTVTIQNSKICGNKVKITVETEYGAQTVEQMETMTNISQRKQCSPTRAVNSEFFHCRQESYEMQQVSEDPLGSLHIHTHRQTQTHRHTYTDIEKYVFQAHQKNVIP